MLTQLGKIVRRVAQQEVMPRYLKVAHSRKSDGSLFTEADLSCQNALTDQLRHLIDCPVLGEEMTEAEQHALWQAGQDGLWCIDPIDGTSNFVNGIPYFAVSVAFMRQGRSVFGVVYNPVTDELFSAERGQGAWLNNKPLPISRRQGGLCHALASVEFKRAPPAIAAAIATHPPFSSRRNFGASTLDWCYVATGRIDAYLHGGQKLWDYAAGSLILEQAGGYCRTLTQTDFWADDPWQRSVVAALDQQVFQEWCDWLDNVQAAAVL